MRRTASWLVVCVAVIAGACTEESSKGDEPHDTEPSQAIESQQTAELPHGSAGLERCEPANINGVLVAIDEDDDGDVDEGCPCANTDLSQACYIGAVSNLGHGICRAGTQRCEIVGPEVLGWSECQGSVTPRDELCGDATDNDCDGETDEGFASKTYYADTDGDGFGDPNTPIVSCAGDVPPNSSENNTDCNDAEASINPNALEECDGIDNDCEGGIDEGLTLACSSACGAGTQLCVDGSWGACSAPQPGTEVCGDGVDQDCSGADLACLCAAGTIEACNIPGAYGVCAAGTRTCAANGLSWGACQPSAGPSTEICGNGIDEDCSGADLPCLCTAGSTRSCTVSGKLGVCAAGIQTCASNGLSWGACTQVNFPTAEVCGNASDENCDGVAPTKCSYNVEILVTGDNAWTGWFDGAAQAFGSSGNWMDVKRYTFNNVALGKHTFAFEVHDTTHEANAFVAAIKIDGVITHVTKTGSGWRVKKGAPSGAWTSTSYDDSAWGGTQTCSSESWWQPPAGYSLPAPAKELYDSRATHGTRWVWNTTNCAYQSGDDTSRYVRFSFTL